MRLLLPALRANWSRLKSRVPALMNAARHRSSSTPKSGFLRRRILSPGVPRGTFDVPQGTYKRTAWFILAWESPYEDPRKHAVAFARPHHLDFGDHLLRVRRSPRFRDDTGTILGELCNFSPYLRRVLRPHSPLASHRPVQLGRRHAPSRHTRNDRRSGRAFSLGNIHAANSGSIWRPLRRFSLFHLRRRSRHRRIRHASLRRLVESKASSIGGRGIKVSSSRWDSGSPHSG